MSEEPVTEGDCGICSASLHTRINERPTLKIVLLGFAIMASLIGYVYAGQGKIEQRQWEFTEKMVTKQDLKDAEARIMTAIKAAKQ